MNIFHQDKKGTVNFCLEIALFLFLKCMYIYLMKGMKIIMCMQWNVRVVTLKNKGDGYDKSMALIRYLKKCVCKYTRLCVCVWERETRLVYVLFKVPLISGMLKRIGLLALHGRVRQRPDLPRLCSMYWLPQDLAGSGWGRLTTLKKVSHNPVIQV